MRESEDRIISGETPEGPGETPEGPPEKPDGPQDVQASSAEVAADPWTTMLSKFSRPASWFGKKIFSHISLQPGDVEAIRECAKEGTLIYVMRYPSILDTMLLNMLLLRSDLPLAHFSNGKSTGGLRPARELLKLLYDRFRPFRRGRQRSGEAYWHWDRWSKLVAAGKPILLFLRGAKLGLYMRRADAMEALESEKDYLAELVRMQWNSDRKIFLIPMAVFWRTGPRQQARRVALSSIFYGVKERPGDVKKFLATLLNYHDLLVRVGKPINLKVFLGEREAEGRSSIVKKVRRSLQLFLYREEKVVQGPVIKPRRQIREIVVGDPEVKSLIERTAESTGEEPAKVRKLAAKYFTEIAANFHGTYIAFLDIIFTWIYRRTFTGMEVTGLEKVADYARKNPLVLIPSHRSHFDYLFMSSLFYHSHLSPPHVAAGVNLSFWPMGPLFRGAGAYFLRRSFGHNELYKLVFDKYITFLIKEGYNQEFFIEGGRSRTGKLLNPKLGMLSSIINAYIKGVRRDLYFVPVGITYERLAEEGVYLRELQGAKKEKESIRAMAEARKVLKHKYGKVHMDFGDPISLHDTLGARLETLRKLHGTPEGKEQTRVFVEEFAYQILRAINGTMTATVSALAATALLASERNAIRRDEFLETIVELRNLLRVRHVRMSAPLAQEDLNFEDVTHFLLSSDLVGEIKDGHEVVYTYDEKRRRALDFYKNNIVHYLVVPSILAQALRQQVTRNELQEYLFHWVQLLRYEFFLPDRRAVQTRAELYLGHFIAEKLIEEDAAGLHPTPEGQKRLGLYANVLANFREAYFVAIDAALYLETWPTPEKRLLSKMTAAFEKYHLLREVRRVESSNPIFYENAVHYMVKAGYLTRRQVDVGKGKSSNLYDRGDRFNDLADLRRSLIQSLESHDS